MSACVVDDNNPYGFYEVRDVNHFALLIIANMIMYLIVKIAIEIQML